MSALLSHIPPYRPAYACISKALVNDKLTLDAREYQAPAL